VPTAFQGLKCARGGLKRRTYQVGARYQVRANPLLDCLSFFLRTCMQKLNVISSSTDVGCLSFYLRACMDKLNLINSSMGVGCLYVYVRTIRRYLSP